jgi:hypothetical protein
MQFTSLLLTLSLAFTALAAPVPEHKKLKKAPQVVQDMLISWLGLPEDRCPN